MPYIKKEDRPKFKPVLEDCCQLIQSEGELNFLITSVCQIFEAKKGASYNTHNTIIGVLECAKQEWYRKKVAPYEDTKCKLNGDVY